MPVFNFVGVTSTLTVTSAAVIGYDDLYVVRVVAASVVVHDLIPLDRIHFWEQNPALHTFRYWTYLKDGRIWKQDIFCTDPFERYPPFNFGSTGQWRQNELAEMNNVRQLLISAKIAHGITDWDWNTLP